MKLIFVALALYAALVPTAIAAAAHPRSGCGARCGAVRTVAHGTLAGTLAVYGAAETVHSCGCRLEAGTLRLTDRSGRVTRVEVGKSWRFTVAVPVGDYRVIGGIKRLNWPMGSCHLFNPTSVGRRLTAKSYIDVGASRVTHVHVGCFGE